jgi:hypothetical protein
MKPSSFPARAVAAVVPPAAGAVPDTPDTRLHGRWLVLARAGWGACVAVIVGLYVVSLTPYVAFLQTPCRGAACAIDSALTPAAMQALHQSGLSLGSYSALVVVLYGIRVLVGCAIGGVIAWRRSDDWMALFVALFLITTAFGNRNTAPDVLSMANAAWWLPVHLAHLLSAALTYLFFFLFPTGHFVPRWTRWVAAMYILQQLAELVLPRESPANLENWPFALGVLSYLPLFLLVLWAQMYRYRRVSTPAQRQQTKWVVFGAVVVAGGLLGASSLLLIFPALQHSLDLAFSLSGLVIQNLPVVLLVCIGVAVLRYRLFDIDVLIRLTLVYGTLSAILAAVYVALVLAAQTVVRALTGQAGQQPAVIVASTLLVAALFNPLRRQLQAFIDRRFYRRRVDAERTLAAFGATLRQEVDVERVQERMLAVVEETMQPEHASLWLRATRVFDPFRDGS